MIPSDPLTLLIKVFAAIVLIWFLSLWFPAFLEALAAFPV